MLEKITCPKHGDNAGCHQEGSLCGEWRRDRVVPLELASALQLNHDVTLAIYHAERLLTMAIAACQEVERIETELSKRAETEEERHLASRGIGASQERIAMLKAILGPDEMKPVLGK